MNLPRPVLQDVYSMGSGGGGYGDSSKEAELDRIKRQLREASDENIKLIKENSVLSEQINKLTGKEKVYI